LIRLYEREDWQARFAVSKNKKPLLLERGFRVRMQPTFTPPKLPKLPKKDNHDSFAQAAKQRMAEAKAGKAKPDDEQPTITDIRTMKRRAEQQRHSAKTQAKMEGEDVPR